MFKQLLVVDSLRGEDSTGVVTVKSNKEVEFCKRVGDPFQLFDSGEFDQMLRGSNKVLIGHNRFATQGKVTRANAHPFDFENVIGVHNGTLQSRHKLDGPFRQVDSEHLYQHINNNGIQDAVDKITGAYALVWYDKTEDRLCFLRNEDRPLNIWTSEDEKTIFWASEAWMILTILNRERYPKGKITELPVDTLYSYEIPQYNTPIKLTKEGVAPKKPMLANLPAKSMIGVGQSLGESSRSGIDLPKFQSQADKVSLLLGKQGLVGRVVGKGRDSHGMDFVSVVLAEYPEQYCRIYASAALPANLDAMVNKVITGDLNSYSSVGGYYKMSPHSVNFITQEIEEEEDLNIDEIDVKVNEKGNIIYFKKSLVTDHMGRELTHEEFDKRYDCCCWCGQSLDYDDVGLKVVGYNDAVCGDCDVDNVKQYIS